MQCPGVGSQILKERWVEVTLDEDSFILTVRFWDSTGSWKDFLEGKKLRWPTVDRFINQSFYNPELKDLHLCLHAPRLDLKGAVQLLGAYSLSGLSSELAETDSLARARLADALVSWTSSQALIDSWVTALEQNFPQGLSALFVANMDSLKVLTTSWLSEVKHRTEDFFRARQACREKVFASCALNLRSDLLLRSSPFSVQLFDQGVVDTILAELRTADKEVSAAFAKKSFTARGQSTPRGQKRKWYDRASRGKASHSSQPFQSEKAPRGGGKSYTPRPNKRQRKFSKRGRGRGRGQHNSSQPPNTSST